MILQGVFTRERDPIDEVAAELTAFTTAAGLVYAETLHADLAFGARSGNIWVQFGRDFPSSAPGEQEQEVSGSLRDSVAALPATENPDDLAYAVAIGFHDEDMEKLISLEVNVADKRYRGWLTETVLDPAIQEDAEKSGINAVRSIQGA